jgi:hypothetical protein
MTMLWWLQRLWRLTSSGGLSAGEPQGPTVTVVEGDRPIRWRQVSRLEEARPDDRVFAFDSATGTVIFGDGSHGRRPAQGVTIRVRLTGSGTGGNVRGHAVRVIEYEFGYGLSVGARTPPGKVQQVMPADGWSLVEATPTGERLTPLVGWALLDPYVPLYREGGESYAPAEQTVRGLIAPAGGPVRIVDELVESFAGYRLT